MYVCENHTFHLVVVTFQIAMSILPTMFVDLKLGTNVWKLAIRVFDMWIVKERNGQQHFECAIQDNKVLILVATMLFNF